MKNYRVFATLLLPLLLVGCEASPWVKMAITTPKAETPEALFDEMIEAVNSRDFKKFYGCLTDDARKDQIHLMIDDLGRGGHVAKDQSDQSGVDPSVLLASPQTALVVIDKYHLPRGRDIKLEELPQENFDVFVLDMWHALQSRKKPFIYEGTAMQEVQYHGDWACAEVTMPRPNRHGDKTGYIYFRKVSEKWRVEMSPWWYPWAKEPRLLSKEQKLRMTSK